MAVETAASFLEVLEKSKLLKSDQLDTARQLASGAADARTLARTLVQKKLLNRWQAGQLLAGRTSFLWGKYRLADLLGRGGMGSVFLAWHTMMNRAVALKIISKELGKDAAALERFFTEARAVAALDHPNIVHAYDVANEGDRYYMVMEYVEGRDLQRIVEDKGRLDFAQAVDYMRQAAEGLAHAHGKDMIHCDIKPANLLVNQQGVIKILDMGMARAVGPKAQAAADGASQEDETLLGTVDYMAPEQAAGIDKLDRRSDIYSLGCTFYFTLVGHPPFPEGTLAERILKHQKEDPKDIADARADTPPELVRICRKMMAKEPDDRFQTADELAKVLADWRPPQAKILRAVPLAEAEAEVVEDEVAAEASPAVKARLAGKGVAKQSAAFVVDRAKQFLDYVMADRRRMMIWGGSAGAVVVVLVCGLLLAMVLAMRSVRKQQQQFAAQQAAAQKEAKAKSGENDFADLESELEKKWASDKAGKETVGSAKQAAPAKPSGSPPKLGAPPPKPGAPPPLPGKTPASAPPAAKNASPETKAAPAPKPAPAESKAMAAPAAKPAEKTAKTPATDKPADEKKTAAAEKKAPAAEKKAAAPSPAPKPAAPPDAFAGFPAFVELPPIGESNGDEFATGRTLLGNVHGPLDTPVTIDLLGKDTALKGKRHFAFEQKDNDEKKQIWIVRMLAPGKEDAPADVAQFIRDKDGLKFQWAEKAAEAAGDYLRNCALELRGGGPAHVVLLRKTEIAEPVVLDLQKGITTASVSIDFMPDPANVRVEFTKVTGQAGPLAMERLEKAAFNPPTPIAPKTAVSLAFPRKALRGHQMPGVEFGIKTIVKGKGLAITVSLSNPTAQWYKGLLAQLSVPANRNELEQKVRGLPQQFAGAKEEGPKAKIADDFEKWSTPLWYEEFYRQAHRNARLHFRVFIEAKDQQIDLVRTEAPK